MENLTEAVIARTRRVPLPEAEPGDGAAVTRQLDAVLASAGFKLSRELVTDLSSRSTGQVLDVGTGLLAAVRRIAGGHVAHNPYFRGFPFGVPDTLEFWAELMAKALLVGVTPGGPMVDIGGGEMVEAGSLLSLPGYGTVQHSYEDMLAAHEALAAAAGDRMTLLHKGGTATEEAEALFLELAASAVPLAGKDLVLLEELADECEAVPERVPVRENRAVLNKIALAAGKPVLADTVTDVLRLAAAVSDGDVTLEKRAKFRSFTRAERRAMMLSLEAVVRRSPAKLGDVPQRAEQWKRLGERIHPHEFGGCPEGQRVFAVARGEERAPSMASRVEAGFRAGRPGEAARVLSLAPGMLLRSLDRLLRASGPEEAGTVIARAAEAAPEVSCRVLLSAREHFTNRAAKTGLPRIFPNRSGRAWVTADGREAMDAGIRSDVLGMLDEAIASRLPEGGRLIIDPAMLGVALPLSGKPAAPGLGVMPRGSTGDVVPGAQDVLSFFVYWRESSSRTDYDLSALMVTPDFSRSEFVSWQNFRGGNGSVTYSGDITSAPGGATEFISVDLSASPYPIVIPQVNIYSGEDFDVAAEAFFGYMLRGAAQKGAPFEAATVRMKSDLRGSGRVAMPLAFVRGEDGRWRAKWLHFYLKGRASMNVVQGHKLSAGLLARTVIERQYLQVRYLVSLWAPRTTDAGYLKAADGEDVASTVRLAEIAKPDGGPFTYIGLERPEGLPADATAYTLANLAGIIPE